MSKYDALWAWFADRQETTVTLTFEEIAGIAGMELDHAFLKYKHELNAMGWQVEKISLKARTVRFCRLEDR